MKGSDDRDHALERLLRQPFTTPQSGASDSCLDAETLAAFSEGGLSGPALEAARVHLADCVRCQSVLGALVRVGAIAPAPRREPLPRRWLAWAVPLTAAAAALVIWIAVPHGPGAAPTQMAEPQAPALQPPVVETPQGFTPGQQPPAATGDQPRRARNQTPELRKDVQRQELDRVSPQSTPAEPATALADKAASAAPAAPSAAPTPAPPAREMLQAPPANTAAARSAGGVITSPDPAIRWRISGSLLEHSSNGGARWAGVTTGIASELMAGSAPSTTVCWVVGRGGVVLRTTDGLNFSRVPFPETVDLSAVQATDDRSATVTATDGRVFTTTDGGRSWQGR